MTRARRYARAAALLLIVALYPACDNVSWGGADLAVVPPPPKAAAAPDTSAAGEPTTERMPQGPVLYHVLRDSMTATMTPVAEVSGDTLIPVRAAGDPMAYGTRLIAEHMRQGSEFALFADGVRAGTFVVQSALVRESPDPCQQRPIAQGVLELSGNAAGVREFLAIAKPHAPQVPRRIDQQLEVSRTMQVVGPILAERMIRARDASLPGSWQTAMEQVTPFPAANQQSAAFATTFLVGDTLGPGLDNEGYSLFFVAIPALASFDTVYVDYRDYPTAGGKQAPRVIDFIDWNRDEQVDLLMQVFSVNDTWYEAVSRGSDGTWRRVLVDRCRAPSAAAPAGEAPDTVG
jgi:hypothetical protein